ncbi:MAG: hypothetical protein KGV44_06250 [Flavobacteriaceae bacterium]|nr:hypothetical protein [Flavobacteriaceae bacterium]
MKKKIVFKIGKFGFTKNGIYTIIIGLCFIGFTIGALIANYEDTGKINIGYMACNIPVLYIIFRELKGEIINTSKKNL